MSKKAQSGQAKRQMKRIVSNLAKDWALGVAFPRAYERAVRNTSVDSSKVLFLDLKSATMPDAFDLMFERVAASGYDAQFVGLGQNEGVGWVAYYRRCLELMPDLAAAAYVFLADANDVVSCVKLRPETKVVQLWHACGAFKKFGVSTADLKFGGTRKEVERHPFYRNLSLVTVSSPEVEWAYREAMMLEDTPEVVRALGVSRTDSFFKEGFVEHARQQIEQAVPQVAGKRILFYAPTFRGKASEATGPDSFDIAAAKKQLGDSWVLLIKHHPFVKRTPLIPPGCDDFAISVKDLPTDVLMGAADALMTDYSSVVFEFSLFDRPMLFFAYDIEEYDDWRGFYYDYNEMTPGPVLSTTQEVIDAVANVDDWFNADGRACVQDFRAKFMSACDGHATTRICEAVGI